MQCHVCGVPSSLMCSRCKAATYCSQTCQRAAWRDHKLLCVSIEQARPTTNEFGCSCCNGARAAPPPRSLRAASAAGDVTLVRALVAAGAGLEDGGPRHTALYLAATAGHATVVQVLCVAGARTDGALVAAAVHCEGIAIGAPGGAAARARSVAVANALLAHGARVTSSALQYACQFDVLALVALLVEHGASVNGRLTNGFTALMVAAESASLPLVELLLEHGADTHATEPKHGWTALHYACTCSREAGDADKIRALLEAGARPDVASVTGSTPLWLAASVRCTGARRGALLSQKCEGASTPIPYLPPLPRPPSTPLSTSPAPTEWAGGRRARALRGGRQRKREEKCGLPRLVPGYCGRQRARGSCENPAEIRRRVSDRVLRAPRSILDTRKTQFL